MLPDPRCSSVVQTLHRHAAATWPGRAGAALCLAADCTLLARAASRLTLISLQKLRCDQAQARHWPHRCIADGRGTLLRSKYLNSISLQYNLQHHFSYSRDFLFVKLLVWLIRQNEWEGLKVKLSHNFLWQRPE